MTAAVRDQQLTVVGAVVYNSYGTTSPARLFTVNRPPRVSDNAELREQNIIYLYAAINLKPK